MYTPVTRPRFTKGVKSYGGWSPSRHDYSLRKALGHISKPHSNVAPTLDLLKATLRKAQKLERGEERRRRSEASDEPLADILASDPAFRDLWSSLKSKPPLKLDTVSKPYSVLTKNVKAKDDDEYVIYRSTRPAIERLNAAARPRPSALKPVKDFFGRSYSKFQSYLPKTKQEKKNAVRNYLGYGNLAVKFGDWAATRAEQKEAEYQSKLKAYNKALAAHNRYYGVGCYDCKKPLHGCICKKRKRKYIY